MTFLLCLGSVAPTFAADKKKGFDASAKHAIAVEATTGKILYEKDATIPLNWLSVPECPIFH